MKYKIRDFSSIFYNAKYGIRNIFVWLPLIWNDRQWDEEYLLLILKKKLDLMEKFFRHEKTYSADALIHANEIRKAKDIISLLIEDDYLYKANGIVAEEIKSKTNMAYVITLSKEQKRKALELSSLLREKDKKELFSLMSDKIDDWWD